LKKYEEIMLEIIRFDTEDIITESVTGGENDD